MAEVTFYDSAEDALLKFAVIIARTDGKSFFVNANAGRCQFTRPGKRSAD